MLAARTRHKLQLLVRKCKLLFVVVCLFVVVIVVVGVAVVVGVVAVCLPIYQRVCSHVCFCLASCLFYARPGH